MERFRRGFDLRSASEKWSEGREQRIAQRSRSVTTRTEPQTEAAADGFFERTSLVTSARFCVVKRAWSKGGQGRPVALKRLVEVRLCVEFGV